MARTIATIIAEMDAAQAAESSLSALNSTSQTSIYKLWKSITATVINFIEQLWDIYKVDLETTVSKGAVGSESWLGDKVKKFQYSATVPQVLEIVDFSPAYKTVDTTLKIISRASVKTQTNKIATIKVATGEPPVALSALQLASLKGYLDKMEFAGVQLSTNSYDSDKFYLKADIYYDGQYASVISATVIAAIELYFKEIPFDGTIKLLTLEDYIQKVPGVTDIVINEAAVRANTTAFSGKTFIVNANAIIFPTYPIFAGYITQETTAGNTFADKLTFISS